jgi:hypothetical protein
MANRFSTWNEVTGLTIAALISTARQTEQVDNANKEKIPMGRQTWVHVNIENTLRANLFNLHYEHQYHDLHEKTDPDLDVVRNGTKVSAPDARYRVNELGSDDWWIKFTVGSLLCRVDKKQCELRKSDECKTATLKIHEIRRTLELLIQPPKSSSCSRDFGTSALVSDVNVGHPLGHAQRPIYVIAHHRNAPNQIGDAIKNGANAIECDIRYHNDQWMVYHGGVDPEGHDPTPLDKWLPAAKKAADDYKSHFSLIIFDNKSPDKFTSHKYQEKFIDVVRSYLPHDLHLLFSVSSYKEIGYLDPIAKQLRDKEGVAVDQSHDYAGIQKHFNNLGISNFWFGDGIAAMLPESKDIWYALNEAGVKRDRGKGIKKTYIWTLEKELSIAEYLSLARVDGVMVSQSHVGHAQKIVNAHREARMATREDPAFQRYTPS